MKDLIIKMSDILKFQELWNKNENNHPQDPSIIVKEFTYISTLLRDKGDVQLRVDTLNGYSEELAEEMRKIVTSQWHSTQKRVRRFHVIMTLD
jgi:hypothetical protein